MRIESQYSRKKVKRVDCQKSKNLKIMISNNLRAQEKKINEKMKEIRRKERLSLERAHDRILG